MSPKARTAQAFVPGHITGLFRIFGEHEDPLYRGSKGAGFSISAGTLTSVTIREQTEPSITIEYNNARIDAAVTKTVVEQLMKAYDAILNVEVTHQSELPIGVGYGASGAGALGTALALSSLLDMDFDYIKAAQYAHSAEVVNHTGLGDVIAQTAGGLEVRTKPGAPGIGSVMNVPFPDGQSVVLAGSTSLETKKVLTNPEAQKRINRHGDSLIDDLIQDASLERIVNASRKFANAIGLMTPRIEDALEELDTHGYSLSSMVMLGDSVFCFCDESQIDHVSSILGHHWKPEEISTTNLSPSGGAIL
ncbi:MAG: pantoate kinase [Candidatus Thorarchaeota archaeon]